MVEFFKKYRRRLGIALAIYLVLTPVAYMTFGGAAARMHLHRLPAILVGVFALAVCEVWITTGEPETGDRSSPLGTS